MVHVIRLATAWQQIMLGTQESRLPCLPLHPPRYLLSPGLRRWSAFMTCTYPHNPSHTSSQTPQPQCWALDTAGLSLDSEAPGCVIPSVCRVGLGKVTGQGAEGPEMLQGNSHFCACFSHS